MEIFFDNLCSLMSLWKNRTFDLKKYFDLSENSISCKNYSMDFDEKNFSMTAPRARIQRASRHTNRTIEAKTNRVNVRAAKLSFRAQKWHTGCPGKPQLRIRSHVSTMVVALSHLNASFSAVRKSCASCRNSVSQPHTHQTSRNDVNVVCDRFGVRTRCPFSIL